MIYGWSMRLAKPDSQSVSVKDINARVHGGEGCRQADGQWGCSVSPAGIGWSEEDTVTDAYTAISLGHFWHHSLLY